MSPDEFSRVLYTNERLIQERDAAILDRNCCQEKCLKCVQALDIVRSERDAWIETAKQHLRNEEYYRDLLSQIGVVIGPDAYKSDDGSIQDSVLCAKLPDLVKGLLDHIEDFEG